MVQAPSRRDRVRAATIEEIKQTARRLLVADGAEAVSLRAIAREMGMTAPALYRYFGSHEDLLANVVGDIFNEISADIQAAISVAAAASGGDLTQKLIAACREFRRWSLSHRPEFSMLFGSPLPALGCSPALDDPCAEAARKFGDTFMVLFAELWLRHPFPVTPDEEIEPGLRGQLARYREFLGADLPLGTLLTFLRCWVRLYGMVCLEVFEHLRFALEDSSPMFEYTLTELAGMIGLRYPQA